MVGETASVSLVEHLASERVAPGPGTDRKFNACRAFGRLAAVRQRNHVTQARLRIVAGAG